MKILLKDKKGITLQVLVIAIIVMIILSTVTLKIITRDDIADTASKSKFVTEVKQIYDKLQSKKVYLELDEEEEKKYDITLEDLDINEELINKYKGKIKIELGNLEKDVNLTEKEEKWLDEMNLQKEIIPYNKGILCALFSETSLDGKQSNSNSSTTPTTWFDETGNGNNGTITGYTWNGNGIIKTNYTTGNKLVIPNVLT